MTVPQSDDPGTPLQPAQRLFGDTEKHTIALESDRLGVGVSQVARKHGIVSGMLFRWRVQFA